MTEPDTETTTTSLVDLADLGDDALELLAHLTLEAAREHSPDWLPDLAAAREQISDALVSGLRIARVALDDSDELVGWIAARHDWGRIWDLHPLIVAVDHQRRGHGRRMVREIERLAAAEGALTLTLSTSDLTRATSLAGADLYADPLGQLARIELRAPHPVGFWRRIGYQIIGVTPDAEGPGMPSIQLARRLDPAGDA